MRTFFAIELPVTLREQIGSIQRQLRTYLRQHQAVDCFNWTAPDKIHLTLRFLGETSQAQRAQLVAGLEPLVKQQQPFQLSLQRVGCFPNFRTPNVVWLGIRGAVAELQQLQQQLEELVQRVGFTPEQRRFSPHLTIARTQRQAERTQQRIVGEALRLFASQAAAQTDIIGTPPLEVSEFVHMQSELRPEGARYTVLHHFTLGV